MANKRINADAYTRGMRNILGKVRRRLCASRYTKLNNNSIKELSNIRRIQFYILHPQHLREMLICIVISQLT